MTADSEDRSRGVAKRILVLDGDPDFGQWIVVLLTEVGFHVSRVYSGEEGLAVALAENPELVIVDRKLSDMEGVAWIRGFRAHRPFTPVFLLSSLWVARGERLALETELHEVFVKHKPLVPEVFCRDVRGLIGEPVVTPHPVRCEEAVWSEEMDRMRRLYRDRLVERVDLLSDLVHRSWEEEAEGPSVTAAVQAAHKLSGSAGTFGYHAAGAVAADIEAALRHWRDMGEQPDWQDMAAGLDRARRSLAAHRRTRPPADLPDDPVPPADTPDAQGRILVIDDDPAFLGMVSDVLGEQGYTVAAVTHMGEPERLLEKTQPDLILVEVDLHPLSGLAFCRRLRAMPEWADVPVLVTTGRHDVETRIRAFTAKADDVVSKPIVGEELTARIALRMAMRRLRGAYVTACNDLDRRLKGENALYDRLADGVAAVDASGHVGRLSPGARRLLGLSDEPLPEPPHDWTEVLGLDAREATHLRRQQQLPTDKRTTHKLTPAHGETPRTLALRVVDDPCHAPGFLVLIDDITELTQLRALAQGRMGTGLVGKSRPMKALFRNMRRLARGSWPLFIEGEPGVGKQLVARTLHDMGGYRHLPFYTAAPGDLSALDDKTSLPHRFAAGGTVYVPEAADLAPEDLESLSRLLQAPHGSGRRKPRHRLTVATSRDSAELRAAGVPEDVLRRMRATLLTVPPLRERPGDIPLLLRTFLDRLTHEGVPLQDVSHAALMLLTTYPWPGNVAELEDAVAYAAVTADDVVLSPAHLPPALHTAPVGQDAAAPAPVPTPRGRFHPDEERNRILAALQETDGNRSLAARLLGMGRATLYRRMRALNLT